MHEGLISIFIANKIFKPFLPKESILDTAILLIPVLSIKIGLLCWLNFYFSISLSSDFIILLSIFIYGFNLKSSTFLFKSAF